MLRNRYYLGVVNYRGAEYPGKHEPLVSPKLFASVQAILDEREQHSLKPRRHQHYLRGLMTPDRTAFEPTIPDRNRRRPCFSFSISSQRAV
jgi:hypothetical protein